MPLPALWGAPHGPPDPHTGLPTIELHPDIAAVLEADGWRPMTRYIEDEYAEVDWILEQTDGPDGAGRALPAMGHSIEPSGHYTDPMASIIFHRGDNCTGPVAVLKPHSPAGIPAGMVLAAARALLADDLAEFKRPCPKKGIVCIFDAADYGYAIECTTCGSVETVNGARHHADEIAARHRSTGQTFTGAPPTRSTIKRNASDYCGGDEVELWGDDAHADTPEPEE